MSWEGGFDYSVDWLVLFQRSMEVGLFLSLDGTPGVVLGVVGSMEYIS